MEDLPDPSIIRGFTSECETLRKNSSDPVSQSQFSRVWKRNDLTPHVYMDYIVAVFNDAFICSCVLQLLGIIPH